MTQADVTAALQERYRALEQLYTTGPTAEQVMDALFWPEVTTTSEGAEKLYRGLAEVLPLAREFVGFMGTDVKWIMHDPVVTSGDLASSFMEVVCRYGGEQPDAHFRALYVWQRRGDEWKVLHEMVVNGPVN